MLQNNDAAALNFNTIIQNNNTIVQIVLKIREALLNLICCSNDSIIIVYSFGKKNKGE